MTTQRESRLAIGASLIGLAALIVFAIAITQVLRNNSAAGGTATQQETPTDSVQATQSFEATGIAEKQTAIVTLAAMQTNQPIDILPRPTGIIEVPDPSFYAQGYAIQNSWQQNVNGSWVQAYAGNLVDDPSRGVVVVVLAWPDRPQGGHFLTPTKSGSVKIVAEQTNRLTLQSDDGTVFYFDVLGMTFVPSLTEFVPTITALPTYTPIPPATPTPVPTGYPVPSEAPPAPTTLATTSP